MRTKQERERLRAFARDLRRAPTDAERALWLILRARQLGGHKFRRQHPFHGYVLDFYCPEARVAIELDGDQHAEDRQRARDERRTRSLVDRGVRVLRFGNRDVLTELPAVAEEILRVIEERLASS